MERRGENSSRHPIKFSVQDRPDIGIILGDIVTSVGRKGIEAKYDIVVRRESTRLCLTLHSRIKISRVSKLEDYIKQFAVRKPIRVQHLKIWIIENLDHFTIELKIYFKNLTFSPYFFFSISLKSFFKQYKNANTQLGWYKFF